MLVFAWLVASSAWAQTAGVASDDVSRGTSTVPSAAAFVDDSTSLLMNPAAPIVETVVFGADGITLPATMPRYAIDDGKARAELGWAPRRDFAAGLGETVRWYMEHRGWWEPIRAGRYAGARLGLADRIPAGHGA